MMFCFQHCSGVTQFCTSHPDTCSQCGAALHASRASDDVSVHYALDPFRIPSPFYTPCSPAPPPATLLVRRTGEEREKTEDILHIGIVDEQGIVLSIYYSVQQFGITAVVIGNQVTCTTSVREGIRGNWWAEGDGGGVCVCLL